jgi:hypothetical protein
MRLEPKLYRDAELCRKLLARRQSRGKPRDDDLQDKTSSPLRDTTDDSQATIPADEGKELIRVDAAPGRVGGVATSLGGNTCVSTTTSVWIAGQLVVVHR